MNTELVAVKEIAEGQKDKIALLREQKSSLQHQVDKLVDDLEIEKKLVYTVQMESIKRINEMKDELKTVKEAKKVLEVESIGNTNDSLIKKIEELEFVADRQEKEFKVKESKNEELERKIEFLKPKLESCVKESQIVNARVQLLEKEKSNYSAEYVELKEKLATFELIVVDRDSLAETNRDLEDEIIGKEQEIEVLNVAIDKATSGMSFHHSATSSLADELDIASNELFEYGPCDDKPKIVQGCQHLTFFNILKCFKKLNFDIN